MFSIKNTNPVNIKNKPNISAKGRNIIIINENDNIDNIKPKNIVSSDKIIPFVLLILIISRFFLTLLLTSR